MLNLTLNVRKMFSEMDEELFQSCQNKFEEEEAKLRETDERRRMMWERIESAANFRQVTGGNTAILVAPLTPPVAASVN